jgi:hypothetical protein
MRTAQAWAEKNGLTFTLLDCVEDMFTSLIERFGTGHDVSAIMREVERSAGGETKKVAS